jgi:acyl phosphate:glycerol-3-phosphate acyltransferase
MIWLAIILLCYLIGSFPSGYLVGKSQGIDIRQHGSGNIGATNVLRVMGKKWGYLVFFCDSLKGFLAYRSGASRLEAPSKYRSSASGKREPLWNQAIAAIC